jgi:hypothetical protein
LPANANVASRRALIRWNENIEYALLMRISKQNGLKKRINTA